MREIFMKNDFTVFEEYEKKAEILCFSVIDIVQALTQQADY